MSNQQPNQQPDQHSHEKYDQQVDEQSEEQPVEEEPIEQPLDEQIDRQPDEEQLGQEEPSEQLQKEQLNKQIEIYNSEQKSIDLTFKSEQYLNFLQQNKNHCKQCKTLSLYCCQINDTSLIQVLKIQWSNLQFLDLGYNMISAKGIQVFLQKNWEKLKELYLWDSTANIGDEGMTLLLKTHSLPILQVLFLTKNNISGIGLKQFPNSSLNKIRILDLNRNPIGSTGIKFLVKSVLLSLQILEVGWCNIGNQGCQYLTKGNWPNLYLLRTYYNKIGIDGYCHLVENNNWRNLSSIYVWQIDVMPLIKFLCSHWWVKFKIFSKIQNKNYKKYIQQAYPNRFTI